MAPVLDVDTDHMRQTAAILTDEISFPAAVGERYLRYEKGNLSVTDHIAGGTAAAREAARLIITRANQAAEALTLLEDLAHTAGTRVRDAAQFYDEVEQSVARAQAMLAGGN